MPGLKSSLYKIEYAVYDLTRISCHGNTINKRFTSVIPLFSARKLDMWFTRYIYT